MSTFLNSVGIESTQKMRPSVPEAQNLVPISLFATAKRFVVNVGVGNSGQLIFEHVQALEVGQVQEQVHPADRDFVLAAREAIFKRFEVAAQAEESVWSSMQFRLVSPDGKIRLVNQVLSPLIPMSQEILKISVVETDFSQLAATPLKIVRVFSERDEQNVSTLDVAGYAVDAIACPFSDRQLQILRLLAEGRTTAEISEALFISSDTVRTHRQHILQRSENANMTATVVNCVRRGWI